METETHGTKRWSETLPHTFVRERHTTAAATMKGSQHAVLVLVYALLTEAAGRAVTPLRTGAGVGGLLARARLALLERDVASLQDRITHELRVRATARGAAGVAGRARGSAQGGEVLDEDDDGGGCGSEGRARFPQFGSDTSEFVFTGATRDMAPNATVRVPPVPSLWRRVLRALRLLIGEHRAPPLFVS